MFVHLRDAVIPESFDITSVTYRIEVDALYKLRAIGRIKLICPVSIENSVFQSAFFKAKEKIKLNVSARKKYPGIQLYCRTLYI